MQYTRLQFKTKKQGKCKTNKEDLKQTKNIQLATIILYQVETQVTSKQLVHSLQSHSSRHNTVNSTQKQAKIFNNISRSHYWHFGYFQLAKVVWGQIIKIKSTKQA